MVLPIHNQRHTFGVVRGFTVLEMLVAIAILLTIVVLTFTGMQRYGQRQEFNTFVSGITDEIYEARQKTIASVGDTTYGVYVGTSTIEFFAGTVPTVGASANTIMTIPAYVQATSSFANGFGYVTFERVTGTATTNGIIELVDTRTLATSTITISATGLVE